MNAMAFRPWYNMIGNRLALAKIDAHRRRSLQLKMPARALPAEAIKNVRLDSVGAVPENDLFQIQLSLWHANL